jgi:hypothetical protein
VLNDVESKSEKYPSGHLTEQVRRPRSGSQSLLVHSEYHVESVDEAEAAVPGRAAFQWVSANGRRDTSCPLLSEVDRGLASWSSLFQSGLVLSSLLWSGLIRSGLVRSRPLRYGPVYFCMVWSSNLSRLYPR